MPPKALKREVKKIKKEIKIFDYIISQDKLENITVYNHNKTKIAWFTYHDDFVNWIYNTGKTEEDI